MKNVKKVAILAIVLLMVIAPIAGSIFGPPSKRAQSQTAVPTAAPASTSGDSAPTELPATRTGPPTAILTVTSAVQQPDPAQPVPDTAVTFGDSLLLLGTDGPHQSSDTLDLVLYWGVKQKLDSPYNFFVHLTDAGSGALVGQLDTLPRDTSYPTTSWPLGDIVTDQLTVSLGDLPQGVYELRVGAYDPATGKHLPIADAAGQPSPSTSLLVASFDVGGSSN